MPDPLTENTRSSEQLVDGRLLKVYRDIVTLPDGEAAVREWINHPGAAAVVPLLPDGATVLVRQYRYAVRRSVWEVPAGKLDHDDEQPEAVAARELREETGFRAGRLTRLASLVPSIGYSNEVIHFYLAEDLTPGPQALDRGEFLEVRRVDLQEAVELARRGAIEDMKTVSALLLAAAHVAERS